MKVGVLTSSRADYGIYLPLLKALKSDKDFELVIIAFGTHLSEKHGNTIDQIYNDGFYVDIKVEPPFYGDSPEGIAKAMAKTTMQFAEVWAKDSSYDILFALGDRFEMFSAVSASVPFNIPIAHLHGGETTLGAIDESFRHSITSMSKIHFASTENHQKRIEQIIGTSTDVYNVGALSIDNINEITLLTPLEFKNEFGVELNNPVLLTFHPETVDYQRNEELIIEVLSSIDDIEQQIIVTMPNSDTKGDVIRKRINDFSKSRPNVFLFESLGTKGYFSCLKYCSFVMGNSSSGIIEAASFGKYVLNLGNRQLGRDVGLNVLHCRVDRDKIREEIGRINKLPALVDGNIYGDGKTASRIIAVLKNKIK